MMNGLRVAMLTPLPPSRTGIANYASLMLPALADRIAVTAFSPEHHAYPGVDGKGQRLSRPFSEYRREEYDLSLYHLGNNPHHEVMYREAMAHPGLIILHDLVLHHLIVEMTLARGDVEGYVDALRASHGEAGAAWARGRAAGYHAEIGNFLLPSSVEVANRSRAVIVHNRYAAGRLKSFGVRVPIHIVPHPYLAWSVASRREEIRDQLGFPPEARVIGLFGFLTSAKRSDVVLASFLAARQREPRLHLLIVGEPAPDIDVAKLAADGVTFTGYAAEEEFIAYYGAVDRLVNLRYPSAGETSGTLIRALEAGKPVAVSDYAQFAEMPDSCVIKIPFGPNEQEALAAFFTRDLDGASIAASQRDWLVGNARMELVIDGYLQAIQAALAEPERTGAAGSAAIQRAVPLFPHLSLVHLDRERGVATVRNDGEMTLRAREYGQPGYRMIARVLRGGIVVEDRWLSLNGDLAPGQTISIPLPVQRGGTLALYHAMESIPMLEPEAFARVPF